MKDRTYKMVLTALAMAFALFAGMAIGVGWTLLFKLPTITAGGMGAY